MQCSKLYLTAKSAIECHASAKIKENFKVGDFVVFPSMGFYFYNSDEHWIWKHSNKQNSMKFYFYYVITYIDTNPWNKKKRYHVKTMAMKKIHRCSEGYVDHRSIEMQKINPQIVPTTKNYLIGHVSTHYLSANCN